MKEKASRPRGLSSTQALPALGGCLLAALVTIYLASVFGELMGADSDEALLFGTFGLVVCALIMAKTITVFVLTILRIRSFK